MPQRYTLYTLVDITNSEITNPRIENKLGYNQQQNLNTILQLIGLRSQPIEYTVSKLEAQDLVNHEFGKAYHGLHTVWKLDFTSEHTDVYAKDNNKTFFLINDCDGAAFTGKLTETVKFEYNTFETTDADSINLYFKSAV